MNMNKKAMEAGLLVATIITIVAFILIAGTVSRWLSSADEKEAETLCHDSIALRAATTININPEKKLTDLVSGELTIAPQLCKTIDKKIAGNREKVKREVADKMARCWWMFGEGRYDKILEDKKVDFTLFPALFEFQNYKNKCFNCYSILIEEIKDAEEIPPQELMYFLSSEKYKKTGETYLDYIQSHGGPGRVAYLAVDEATQKTMGVKSHQAYGISIMPKLPAIDQSKSWGAAKIGGAVGIAIILGEVLSGPPGWIALGATLAVGGTALSGWNDIMNALYGEREVSSIYFNTLARAEKMCGSKDIAGE